MKARNTKSNIFTSGLLPICRHRILTPALRKIYNWIFIINISVAGIATGIQWLSISKAFSVGTQPQTPFYVSLCSQGSFLTDEQQQICRRYYSMMRSVAQGASMAVNECQRQFNGEKWNCSTQRHRRRAKRSVFGRSLTSGTRESAFVYAISSAAVAYSVTRDCSKGLINDCGCDKSWPHHAQISQQFEWGGCSDNIAWGKEMSRKFIDIQEQPKAQLRRRTRRKKYRKRLKNEITVNLNNNRIGRETVGNLMRHQCKCHGVSSSCDVVTCWRSLPAFNEVGKTLKTSYGNAVQVHVIRKHDRPYLKAKGKSHRPYGEIGLGYLRKSPESCDTRGRSCNPDPSASNNCHTICCGRGYDSRERHIETKCRCKFKWCCVVNCDTCNTTVTEHICR